MKKIKCLIPAAGKGTRMRPLTHSLPKAMLPVAGKPTIFHIIDKVADSGVSDFVIITGYLRDLMEDEILRAYPNLKIEFVEQKEQKGLGHAIFMAQDKFKQNEAMLLIYGDTLFEADLSQMIQSPLPVIGVSEVADARRFGIVELDPSQKYITNFIEKPEHPPTNLAIPGVNFFPSSEALYTALKWVIDRDIKVKGEYQVTDAFTLMLKESKIQMSHFLISAWYDAGTLETMLETNALMLEQSGSRLSYIPEDSEIIDPVYLADGVVIKNSVIGPNVSLGPNCKIIDSKIKNTIIDQDSAVTNSVLEAALIGRSVQAANIKGSPRLGDHSIVLNE